jgi:hypothetical protein
MELAMSTKHEHFKGKDVYQHLKDARNRGKQASEEIHGTEASGSLIATTDSVKETAIVLLSLWMLFHNFSPDRPLTLFCCFLIGWVLWKGGRSALLGWNRLERLHRLIEEERYEIQHHRAQEKEELKAMYELKGLSGDHLEQVVEILASDDNRLLQVMLEEELGLRLESFEHPLKQGIGAALGALISGSVGFLGGWLFGFWGVVAGLALLFSVATLITAKREANEKIRSLIWNLAVGLLSMGVLYILLQIGWLK